MRALLPAVALAAVVCSAGAQTYPLKPVRMIAPYPAGGTSDTIARILGQKLTESWGQQVIVDNRAGVGGPDFFLPCCKIGLEPEKPKCLPNQSI